MEQEFLSYVIGAVEVVVGAVLMAGGLMGLTSTHHGLRKALRHTRLNLPKQFWFLRFRSKHKAQSFKITGLRPKRRVIQKRHGQRGFALAPVLYALTLMGVASGILFSGHMQILHSTQTVQNAMTVKSDLQAAANTLSAEGVFSADGLTFCPPRSSHQSSGNPCALAPVSLIQFADYAGSQLPANYTNASSTGSPAEIGVFSTGAGVKFLDPYGHAYIYCRWENPRSNPSANAFVLLSAGSDGNLQTKCGDTSAQGDDGYIAISVATAINRAALWQANGNSISYGAAGSEITIDNSGNLAMAGNLAVAGSTATQALTSDNLTVANSATINGTLRVRGGTATISAAGDAALDLWVPDGSKNYILFGTAGIGQRWWLQTDGQWENGSNTGSNFAISRFGDAGNWLGYALTINRSSGLASFQNSVTVGGTLGIGVSNPQATVDINGTLKLASQVGAPSSCSSSVKGSVAMTNMNGLCFCNGSTWNKVESPAAICSW